jgi:hypothetical protein
MVLAQEAAIVINPVSSVIKASVLSAFSFLAALSIRDVFQKTMESVLPSNAKERLVFTYAYASFVVLMFLLLAWLWKSNASSSL